MDENCIFQLVPNKWVSEQLLMALSGMSKHMIQHARRTTWLEGREYRHVAPDLNPKMNSPIMYNREAVDNWVEKQRPAIRRRITK
ncbi:excisionase family protein [Serratia sp. TSA_198.1]|uniref:excisionase family protein n=1 Tax=Serratia sp. TSA_198.1 TaxID=3415664 RepID=UPI0040453950